jgi:hypothetical protein
MRRVIASAPPAVATSISTTPPMALPVGLAGAAIAVSVDGSVADGLAAATLADGEAAADADALAGADAATDAEAAEDAEAAADADALGLSCASAPPAAIPSIARPHTTAMAGAASRGPRRGADDPCWGIRNLLLAAHDEESDAPIRGLVTVVGVLRCHDPATAGGDVAAPCNRRRRGRHPLAGPRCNGADSPRPASEMSRIELIRTL